MAAAPHYPPAAAARMTGLSIDTLRAWERRYGAVTPARDTRGRLYSARDIGRLRQLAALVARGHSIGRIVALSPAALRQLRAESRVPMAAVSIELNELRQALSSYDIDAIERTLGRHSLLLPPSELIFAVILPLMRDVGARWQSGSICTAHEHLVSSAVRNVLAGLLRSMARDATQSTIAFAAPSGQRHELGLLCAAVLAASARHRIIYLGADLPATDIAQAVRAAKAARLVLAATVADRTRGGSLRDLRLPRGVQVVVGGAYADALCAQLGSRARQVERLEDFRTLLDDHHA